MTCKMCLDSNKIYGCINPLLGLLAVFNIALTLYCCTQFYAYLPTSDTWIYVDFLAQASQGHLDFASLFEKHNGVHVIALPKLVYFLDVWLTQGGGALTVVISLLAQLASAGIFIDVISKANDLNKNEKFFLGIAAIIVLLSACQVESLLNPANLQWSLLVFSGAITGWFAYRYIEKKSLPALPGIVLGAVLVGFTSASVFLAVIPLLLVFSVIRWGKLKVAKAVGILLVSLVGFWSLVELIAYYLFSYPLPLWTMTMESLGLIKISAEQQEQVAILLSEKYLEMYFGFWINWINFIFNFYFPPVERLHIAVLTYILGIIAVCFLLRMIFIQEDAPHQKSPSNRAGYFLGFMVLFSLGVILATATARFYAADAFTFRFVNIGLLFSLAFFALIFFYRKQERVFYWVAIPAISVYLVLLSYVNMTEASAFGFGRNHVRLNQVAYAVDVQHPSVISALPGTPWEKQDYDFVQASKEKLRERNIGIYSDERYLQTGKPVSDWLGKRKPENCLHRNTKVRRLTAEQAAYKLEGVTETRAGKRLSEAYFVDEAGIVRGFALSLMVSKTLWQRFWQARVWIGFANLDDMPGQKTLRIYAYNDDTVCASNKIDLPAFQPFIKKEKNSN